MDFNDFFSLTDSVQSNLSGMLETSNNSMQEQNIRQEQISQQDTSTPEYSDDERTDDMMNEIGLAVQREEGGQ